MSRSIIILIIICLVSGGVVFWLGTNYQAQQPQCQVDADCKVLYNSCNCQAVAKDYFRKESDISQDAVCITNICRDDPSIRAICRQGRCSLGTEETGKQAPKICDKNYVFSAGRILSYVNPLESELRRSYQQGKCLDDSSPEQIVIRPRTANKNCADCEMQEIIYYCPGDNQFMVELGQSEMGAVYYLFSGKPCK